MFRIVVSIIVMTAGCVGIANAQVPHIFGSWRLDVDVSTFPGPQPRSQVRTYHPLDDDYFLGIAVTVDAQGNASFLQFTAKTDGRDYPEYDPFALARLQVFGDRTSATYSETRLNDYTVEWVDKRDGEPTASGIRTVTEDGQILTIEYQTRGSEGQVQSFKMVYNKQ